MDRKVGVEIEFLGIELGDAARVIAAELGVDARATTAQEYEFDSEYGAYRLEIDFELLKRLGRSAAESEEHDTLRDFAVDVLTLAASIATPLELVTPPLARTQLSQLDSLLTALAEGGARGTGESVMYAFGVHFNPEAELSAQSITSHLQAYLCLHPWLSERDATDWTRQLSAFALPFSSDFEEMVLRKDYKPDQAQLIDDYLQFNPTRNRALDLLPLLTHLDASRVQAIVDDARVNARPTYHYRLPNSQVGDPEWSLLRPWRDWLVVEHLARSPQHLHTLCAARLEHLAKGFLTRRNREWINRCDQIVDDLLSE